MRTICSEGDFTGARAVAALGMRALAAPLPGDAPIVSGESGAAGFGARTGFKQEGRPAFAGHEAGALAVEGP